MADQGKRIVLDWSQPETQIILVDVTFSSYSLSVTGNGDLLWFDYAESFITPVVRDSN